MSKLEHYARVQPDKPAYVMVESGLTVTWRTLEERSARCARLLLDAGLREGDVVVVFMENSDRYFEILWAARRIGLYYSTISRHLRASEAEFIIQNSGAKALFVSAEIARKETGLDQIESNLRIRFAVDGSCEGYTNYDAALAAATSTAPLPETLEGTDFLYSSGTTGKPKGVKRSLKFMAANDLQRQDIEWKKFGPDSVYLSTAPLYHAAPVRWNMSVLSAGGTCIVMQKFDAERALKAIQDYRVTHSQWVPTMFVRLLRLPGEVHEKYDLSSMRYAIHAAAPCAPDVKEAMIKLWGPIIYEYYSGTEAIGRTSISSQEWLAHRGSVGRPELGQIHVLGEDGEELPPGKIGAIYFSGVGGFEYHNDPGATAAAFNERGWATIGDVGYIDEEGYLYLTDRASNMIISGGVNIYPQEAENVFVTHPRVADVAVIGVPNQEFGEEVRAVVQLRDPADASPQLAQELIAYCRERISPIKCPRSVEFVDSLPRTETGKLIKRYLLEKYKPATGA